jgi:hypothetical protein
VGGSVAYTTAQVTTALMQLVANGGNVKRTAEELIDEEFQVPETTLRAWKNDVHAERYRQLEDAYGSELEAEAVQAARLRLQRAAEIEGDLLERAGEVRTPELVPQALRAVADVKSKSGNLLMQLTGRPTAPKDTGNGDVIKLLQTMADRGYLSLAAPVAKSIEGSATEETREDGGPDGDS